MTHRTARGAWFKSSYSENDGTNCLEVADLTPTGQTAIRDSKHPAGPILLIPTTAWTSFITTLRHNRLTPARPS